MCKKMSSKQKYLPIEAVPFPFFAHFFYKYLLVFFDVVASHIFVTKFTQNKEKNFMLAIFHILRQITNS